MRRNDFDSIFPYFIIPSTVSSDESETAFKGKPKTCRRHFRRRSLTAAILFSSAVVAVGAVVLLQLARCVVKASDWDISKVRYLV